MGSAGPLSYGNFHGTMKIVHSGSGGTLYQVAKGVTEFRHDGPPIKKWSEGLALMNWRRELEL